MESVKIYIAGPMTGIPNFNYPAFIEASKILRCHGFDVLSPTEHTADEPPESYTAEHPYPYYLRRSLQMMLGCDVIVMLPQWFMSRGAVLENHIAKELDMPVVEYSDSALLVKLAMVAV